MKAMSRKTKGTAPKEEAVSSLVPKLRFPEFRGAEGWEIKPLGDICDYWNGGSNEAAVTEDGEYFLISLNSIDIEGNLKDDMKRLSKTDNSLQKDDLVMVLSDIAHGNFLGLTDIIPNEKYVLNQRMAGLRTRKESSGNVVFLRVFINKNQNYFKQLGQGSSQQNLAKSAITDFPVFLPRVKEQQKIAECLSSVDEVIAAQARKLGALKTHKKGLMQQLFPGEGETQPRLRFPEFQSAPEWVQKTVGDVSEVLMCKRIFAEETNPNVGVPFYKIGTLGGIPDAFISREWFEDYKSRYNYPRKGEILITCSGTVGKCLPYDGNDAYFQDSNIVWLDNPTGEVSNKFLLMLLSNVNWGRLNSTTITRIYGPDLRGVTIKFPGDEDEQQRIATCLTTLDDLIAAETQKLEVLKAHKRGLMQQLFPSPEAVEA